MFFNFLILFYFIFFLIKLREFIVYILIKFNFNLISTRACWVWDDYSEYSVRRVVGYNYLLSKSFCIISSQSSLSKRIRNLKL